MKPEKGRGQVNVVDLTLQTFLWAWPNEVIRFNKTSAFKMATGSGQSSLVSMMLVLRDPAAPYSGADGSGLLCWAVLQRHHNPSGQVWEEACFGSSMDVLGMGPFRILPTTYFRHLVKDSMKFYNLYDLNYLKMVYFFKHSKFAAAANIFPWCLESEKIWVWERLGLGGRMGRA